MSAVIHAVLDGEDRLLSDDPRLAELHRRLGGAAGSPVRVAQIAALGRAVRRLGRMVIRPVTLSTADAEIAMWVRAQPLGDNVRLTLFDWTEELSGAAVDDPGHGAAEREAEAARDAAVAPEIRSSPAWSWRVDAAFRLLDVSGPAPLPSYGTALTRWLALEVDEDGVMPLLVGVAARAAFTDQPARLVSDLDAPLLLAGRPIDIDGRFVGYRGTLKRLEPGRIDEAEPQQIPAPVPELEPVPEMAAPIPSSTLDNALRRPLGRIIANADTISARLEGPLRRDYAGYASDIAVAGRHLMALVDDLADLRAIERPNFTVVREQVDLSDVARRAGGLLAVKAADRKIALDLPANGDPLIAAAEFRRVLQILVNLIGNAVRYSPEGSQVWVRGEIVGDSVTITVADQGRGIAPEDQARIFDKFERLGRRDSGGSGLGLYISRRLARAMGGDIVIDSAPGQGARFTLSLPAWKADA